MPDQGLLDRVGSKWTVMTVLLLAEEADMRFSELRRAMACVSQKMRQTPPIGAGSLTL